MRIGGDFKGADGNMVMTQLRDAAAMIRFICDAVKHNKKHNLFLHNLFLCFIILLLTTYLHQMDVTPIG